MLFKKFAFAINVRLYGLSVTREGKIASKSFWPNFFFKSIVNSFSKKGTIDFIKRGELTFSAKKIKPPVLSKLLNNSPLELLS